MTYFGQHTSIPGHVLPARLAHRSVHTELTRTEQERCSLWLCSIVGCPHFSISDSPSPPNSRLIACPPPTRYECFPDYFNFRICNEYVRGSMTAWPQASPFSPDLPICLPHGCSWTHFVMCLPIRMIRTALTSVDSSSPTQTRYCPLLSTSLWLVCDHSSPLISFATISKDGHFILSKKCTEFAGPSGF